MSEDRTHDKLEEGHTNVGLSMVGLRTQTHADARENPVRVSVSWHTGASKPKSV